MRSKTIDNVQGAWTAGATYSPAVADPDYQLVAMMRNGSGVTLAVGDVVICTDPAGLDATTTTTASDVEVMGVVGEPPGGSTPVGAASSGTTYAAGAMMPVVINGIARINIGGNTVADKDNLSTTTAAKVAGHAADAANVGALQALVGSFIAIAKEANAARDANNTIRADIRKM